MAAGAEVRLSRAAVAHYAEMLRSGANGRFREAATQHLSNAEWPVWAACAAGPFREGQSPDVALQFDARNAK